MKLSKLTSILLAGIMLSACLLPLSGCKKKTNDSDNPFNVGSVNTGKNGQTNNAPASTDGNGQSNTPTPDTGWTQGTVSGEKRLYGKQNYSNPQTLKIGDEMSGIMRYGDMLIGEVNYDNKFGYYSFDDPDSARLICFDPLCLHLIQQDSCPAFINYKQNINPSGTLPRIYSDPMGMYIDLYESTDGPVIYRYYKRSDYYTVGVYQQEQRESFYCIERYDMAKGKLTAVLDNEKNTITQACNYGDYIYYVLDCGKEGQIIHRIHKSGGKPERYDLEEEAESIFIVDVVDDKLYYVFDEQYLYRASLDLTENEEILDLSELKGTDGTVGVMQGIYCGYLYYIADVSTVWAGTPENSPSTEKANLYRIPIGDLTKAPEMVVEGMNIGKRDYLFSENTMYYTPCVFEYGEYANASMAVNVETINKCDGKMMALDLNSGNSKTVVEDSGMTISPLLAWDDRVVFAGWAYTSAGKDNAGESNNLLIAYTSGEAFEVWCRKGAPGQLDDEYVKSIDAAEKAAINEWEAQQNKN